MIKIVSFFIDGSIIDIPPKNCLNRIYSDYQEIEYQGVKEFHMAARMGC